VDGNWFFGVIYADTGSGARYSNDFSEIIIDDHLSTLDSWISRAAYIVRSNLILEAG